MIKKKMFSEFINFLINLLFLFKNNSQNLLQKQKKKISHCFDTL